MEILYSKCGGLDVHKNSVVACARCVGEEAVSREHATFGTTTAELFKLAEWLADRGIVHAVMESTGVYWKPVWNILALSGLELTLGNAAHIRNVPGRKTDVNDATWLADLHAHGLVRGSFVPPIEQAELRDVVRTRKQFVRERTSHVLRVQKTLEDANLKICSVITDITGKTGRAILNAMIAGESDPATLADLARGRARAKLDELALALRGLCTSHHRFMLQVHLDQIDRLDAAIGKLDEEADRYLAPFADRVELLKTIPGVHDTVAEVLAAEVGLEMDRFASAAHLRSWAGLCPRSDVSAGKHRSTRIRKSNNWLKTALVQAATSAARTKGTSLSAMYGRLKARRGHAKAIIALAAQMLTAAYHMLRNNQPYTEIAAATVDIRSKEKIARKLTKRLTDLGFDVQIQVAA